MRIFNLTQHSATQEQREAGVIEPMRLTKEEVRHQLTFTEIPTPGMVQAAARELAYLAALCGCEAAMIGGAPYLMGPLENALKAEGVTPLYAFSERVSEDVVQEDGSVRKVAVFRHLGFVEG